VLLLIKPSIERVACKHVVVSGFKTSTLPNTLFQAFYSAQCLGANKATVVEEIANKSVKVSIDDDRSLIRSLRKKRVLEAEEDRRVAELINQLPAALTDSISIQKQAIFGKRGYSIGHYAEVTRADLLVMDAPVKTSLLSRIITRDIEFILSDLPSDLLICRAK
jgi:carbamoylphosphate synthase small subunit